MTDAVVLEREIIEKLRLVIDPETNVDVVRMRLIEDLQVESSGLVCYTVRPSSPMCPVAVFLALQIKGAISQVPGVRQQQIMVKDYVGAEELTKMINEDF